MKGQTDSILNEIDSILNDRSFIHMLTSERVNTIDRTDSYISKLFEHGWYQWVKVYNSLSQFPDNKEVLGRYLGPSLDVRLAMMAKILKAKGNTTRVSTYRGLTDQYYASEAKQKDFTESLNQKLGPPSVTINDQTVANGNETGGPSNLIEVKTLGIKNAYLTAPTEERLYTILGPEFGEDEGKPAVMC